MGVLCAPRLQRGCGKNAVDANDEEGESQEAGGEAVLDEERGYAHEVFHRETAK